MGVLYQWEYSISGSTVSVEMFWLHHEIKNLQSLALEKKKCISVTIFMNYSTQQQVFLVSKVSGHQSYMHNL